MEKSSKELFRGIKAGPYAEVLKQLEKGAVLDLQHPVSASSVLYQAQGFAEARNGVILHFINEKDGDILNSVSITGLSSRVEEGEVLIGDRYWEVVEIDRRDVYSMRKDNHYHIKLRRVKK